MKNRLISSVVSATLLTAALAPTGCGYFLHPERRGNTGGGVDGTTLIFDLLWLIPGVVPGVVALIVDFSSGAIYVGRGGRTAIVLTDKGAVKVQVPKSATAMSLELRLIRAVDQTVLTRKAVLVQPNVDNQIVELQLEPSMQSLRSEKIILEVVATK